ncbi:CoA activase [candidate division GN15 bacterium]|nr:CoA activase [candidate division GN15 bacterium]
MAHTPISLGIDIGSVAVKLVIIEQGTLARTVYRRFDEGPFETLRDILREEFPHLQGARITLGHTGIGAKTAQSVLRGKAFGEIAALAQGNFLLAPQARTVIEMGGEDSKLLILDPEQRAIVDFAMNAQCAAGTGSFLDQQAGRLKIDIESEFGGLALKSQHPPRIAGRCSVFAKSDMIHLQQIATPDYDIVAGLCFAVARNFKSAIARGKKLEQPIAFEGGVAANPGMVRAFTEVLELEPGELVVPEHYNVVGAVGAAVLANEQQTVVEDFDISRIDAYLDYREGAEGGREALSYNFPDLKHYDVTRADRPTEIDNLEVFLGVDIGSLSTNLVLIDRDHRVIARRYLMTEGRPIEAVRKGLAEIGMEVGDRVKVVSVGTTGSGRYLIADFIGGDIVRNEITAQATAAVAIDPTVDTIFEIGGQDSKYISIDKKAVIDFEMNKACAAGTGSFLQEQAEKLKINIESEFGDRALCAECPVGCGERCTVFMESDLVAHMRSGARKDDLIAGLAYSIASNYLNKVVGDRRIGDNIFFQGGVAWNKGVVAAFEKLVGKEVTVPPHHDVTGAIGAAILAIEKADEPEFETRFKGFELYKRKYNVSTFPCEDCSNHCEIRKVEIEGEDPMFYGARCEKYEVNRVADRTLPRDYNTMRQRGLYCRRTKFKKPKQEQKRVGFPRVLHFFEFYPFWLAFFESLGYKVVLSDVSNHQIVEDSLELFAAETCYPIKLVYGHVNNLVAKNVDLIFLPSLIKVAEEHESADEAAYICPYVQTIGSAIQARFDFDSANIRFLTPAVMLSYDVADTKKRLRVLAKELELSDRDLTRATRSGINAYKAFKDEVRESGRQVLDNLKDDDKVLVLVSRPYNGFDRRLSLELPQKIRDLGYEVIPMDFLPVDTEESTGGTMYWRYGRRIMSAAKYIRSHPNLFAVYITSFGCGPDSFIMHYFRRAMTGKPYLQLELDEHSADAGLITRCEAFIDSLRFYKYKPPITEFNIAQDEFRPFEKTIYIPNMCDHAYALRAAFDRYGLTAEVLDEPDDTTLSYGQKFTSGKECFPCVITTGDMIKKCRSDGFDTSKSVFFMPGADGPCRFGQYSQLHRIILDELGYKDVPIFSPNSNDGYSQFGLDGTGFRTTAWKGLVFVDCMMKLAHQTRPYEINAGETDLLYESYLRRMDEAIRKDIPLEDVAEQAGRDFAALRNDAPHKPLVGVVGEIYLRSNRFSNNNLIRKLESYGLEVWLATFTEWPLYTSTTYQRDALLDWNIKALAHSSLQLVTQRWQEHRIMKAAARNFPLRHEQSVGSVMDLASRYMSKDLKGEAILSVGKSMEMAEAGAMGIVNAMPFNCMPGTVVSSLSRKLSEDLGGMPWLNISYEGLRDSGEDTRLEAFADQVYSRSRRSTMVD